MDTIVFLNISIVFFDFSGPAFLTNKGETDIIKIIRRQMFCNRFQSSAQKKKERKKDV